MGDYLDTVVRECKVGEDSTDLVLSHNVTYEIRGQRLIISQEDADFELPFKFPLQKGDRLEFYLGCVTNGEVIYHRDYAGLTIHRQDKPEIYLFREEVETIERMEKLKQEAQEQAELQLA